MKRIHQLFSRQKAFVGYITVGDGGLDQSYQAAKALIAGGVNLLELGVPFSDPVADGPVIAMASQRALECKTTLQDVLELARKLRKKTEIPIILFSYFNPLLNHFTQAIFTEIKMAGIDGILVVDLPIEESNDYQQACLMNDLAPIYVITPETTDKRIRIISRHGKGFLYYACRPGTTGMKQDVPLHLADQMQRIKALTHLPVVVGFGISTPLQTKLINEIADGIVVGSLFVDAIAKNTSPKDLTQLAGKLINFEGGNHATDIECASDQK